MAGEKDKQRWLKLTALANSPGASPAERKTARKLLCELDARMGGFSPINSTMDVEASQAWEVALLTELGLKHSLSTTRRENVVRLAGKHEDVEQALLSYCQLHPDLERVVMLAAAGWLARNFPKTPTGPAGPQLDADEAKVVRAAATAARPERYERLRIGMANPKRLTKKD